MDDPFSFDAYERRIERVNKLWKLRGEMIDALAKDWVSEALVTPGIDIAARALATALEETGETP